MSLWIGAVVVALSGAAWAAGHAATRRSDRQRRLDEWLARATLAGLLALLTASAALVVRAGESLVLASAAGGTVVLTLLAVVLVQRGAFRGAERRAQDALTLARSGDTSAFHRPESVRRAA
jgi:hypothetical protein